MRGLKPFEKHPSPKRTPVASFTDAWIETQAGLATCFGNSVASFTDAWIETSVPPADVAGPIVASFTDAWIETLDFK